MTPPIVVDTLTFNDDTDFEALTAEILSGGGGVGSNRGDSHPLDWINRAYNQVKPTPYACRLAQGVASCLTAANPRIRAQALVFFQTHPSACGADRITTLAAGNRDLFRAIDDPIHPGTDLEWQLLTALAAQIEAHNTDALTLARTDALHPGKAAPLIASLIAADPTWTFANAEKIVQATPEAGATILIQAQTGNHDIISLAQRITPLCHNEPRFKLDISRFITNPTTRQKILDTFTQSPD
ncbi:hypothetical protein JOF56_004553 [Kibdelosporangium banguiense]|uniref:HEAT repeat domain-containing protein n=1 Tax=Kibdelosporangium banguiense TaxID=1365924 RepID=A0ABS4TIB3_9PSEU|nr:hypothetical protein [Kibdelosporangium banguiense]MBP2324168.1 hypothetical protein [Kibdelosporangium banguiense]